MTIVKFNHKDYGEMTTTAKNWIEYLIFDACLDGGDEFPVCKEACSNPYVEEL